MSVCRIDTREGRKRIDSRGYRDRTGRVDAVTQEYLEQPEGDYAEYLDG